MAVERKDPAPQGGERELLEAFLEYHRATLEQKVAGLPPERLAERSAPPSSLSLLGLVRHLADVERTWFRVRLAGEDLPNLYGTFHAAFDADGADPGEALEAWRTECGHARRVAADRALDDLVVVAKHGHEPVSLRWIYLHMLEEYARHNGHADLLRERIDGATGE